jgi:hypothetical protein
MTVKIVLLWLLIIIAVGMICWMMPWAHFWLPSSLRHVPIVRQWTGLNAIDEDAPTSVFDPLQFV